MHTGGCVHVYVCLCVLEWQRTFFLMWQKPKTTKIAQVLVSAEIVAPVVVPSYFGMLCSFLKNVSYFS